VVLILRPENMHGHGEDEADPDWLDNCFAEDIQNHQAQLARFHYDGGYQIFLRIRVPTKPVCMVYKYSQAYALEVHGSQMWCDLVELQVPHTFDWSYSCFEEEFEDKDIRDEEDADDGLM